MMTALKLGVRWLTPPLVALCMLSGRSSPAEGQLLSVRTLPLAAGNQFSLSPSQRGGMGGLTIALSDELADPFLNPSLGKNLDGSWIAVSPASYGFEWGERGARSLPVTGLFKGEQWFGGLTLAFQQLRHEQGFNGFIDVCCFPQTTELLRNRSSTNLYADGFIGTTLGAGSWSVGLGASVAGLNGVDGVELLYAGAQSIEQSGSVFTLRGGLSGTTGDGAGEFELVGAYRQFDMRHDVNYLDWIWTATPVESFPQPVQRFERNLDHTDTWGIDSKYAHKLAGTSWKVGGVLTANYKDHPKIPNYRIMNVPRDPGHTWVYNLGVGMARETAATTFGFDLVLEPAWSNTWADAATQIRRADGSTIAVGEKTIENDFTFLNSKLRVGFEQRYDRLGFQLGLGVTSFDYDLTQLDRVALTLRDEAESWIEWTPSWGLTLEMDEAQLRYSGWSLVGAGTPGVGATFGREGDATAAAGPDYVVAASGPLTLQDVRVTTHRITISLPLKLKARP